jgi:hypothetical protein
MAQALFDQRSEGGAFSLRHAFGLIQDAVSNLNGGFHMGSHICSAVQPYY